MPTRTANSVAAAIVVLFAGIIASTTAHAQNSQWCPQAGTVVHYTGTDGAYTRAWLGPDPSDPMVCRRKVDAGVGEYLVGWPRVDGSYKWSSDTIQRMHEAYRAVLSGQKDEASLDFMGAFQGDWHSYSGIITVKREGQEEILIDDQSVSTIKLLENHKVNDYATNFTWILWYDPDRHIFVKGTRTGNVGWGNSLPAHFEATSISVAN